MLGRLAKTTRFLWATVFAKPCGRPRRRCMQDAQFAEWAAEMLRMAGTGISGLRTNMVNVSDDMPEEIVKSLPDHVRKSLGNRPKAEVLHRIEGTNEVVPWGIEDESLGTQQLFGLLGAWYGILHEGSTAIVDELDSSLHALLSRWLLALVHSSTANPSNGQLIFTTHDTSLLDLTLLRRDQVCITNRHPSGATQLCSLLDYKPRKDEALQKGYLAGFRRCSS
jgi:hypothetical protein